MIFLFALKKQLPGAWQKNQQNFFCRRARRAGLTGGWRIPHLHWIWNLESGIWNYLWLMDTILDSPDSTIGQQLVYGAVWQRALATFIDAAILVGIHAIPANFDINMGIRHLGVYIMLCFGIFYHIYLVSRFGATPGKMLVGLKIVIKDGRSIAVQNAVMRYAVAFAFYLFMAVPDLVALDLLDQHLLPRTIWITEHVELFNININIPGTLFGLWYVPTTLLLLFHPQRRTLHDFIAGTVVIRKFQIPDSKSEIQ
jgi:uncharacterized RDD family membrane protein YckC